jgi:hypothetical protein
VTRRLAPPLLPLVLLWACAEKPAPPPLYPKALAAALAPMSSAEPPKKESLPGKVVPVWVQRSLVPEEVLSALPEERRASNDGEAKALARIDCRSEPMGTYTDGVPAYRSSCTVTVLNLRTGAPTARKVITGKIPPQTQQEGRFSSMTPPDYAAIAAWLASLPLRP